MAPVTPKLAALSSADRASLEAWLAHQGVYQRAAHLSGIGAGAGSGQLELNFYPGAPVGQTATLELEEVAVWLADGLLPLEPSLLFAEVK